MTCYFPVHGYRAPNGQIVSSPTRGYIDRPASRRCGNCDGCRYDKAASWAVRCMHESQLHKENIFITLTYRPEDLPYPPSLDLKTYQDFNKRLRQWYYRKQRKAGVRPADCKKLTLLSLRRIRLKKAPATLSRNHLRSGLPRQTPSRN